MRLGLTVQGLWHESSTSSPSPLKRTHCPSQNPLTFTNQARQMYLNVPLSMKSQKESLQLIEIALLWHSRVQITSAGGYYVIIAFHWKRFVQWTCRISENLSGECQLSKIGLWQQETEEVLMVSVITDIGFTLGVIAFNPQRKSGRPEQRDVQVQHVSSTGWLKHSPPERGRLLYSSLIAIKGRGGEKKRKINFSEELTHSSSLKMTV